MRSPEVAAVHAIALALRLYERDAIKAESRDYLARKLVDAAKDALYGYLPEEGRIGTVERVCYRLSDLLARAGDMARGDRA